jgi:predicted adenylyl cyclase CyaB
MRNLEIKCSYPDQECAERVAVGQVHARRAGQLVQTDTYFRIHPGRLKLREIEEAGERGFELIAYRRPNRRSPRTSSYQILPVPDGPKALQFFTDSLGIKVQVHKVRKLFLKENLRIHVDTVRGLGKFLEMELIVSAEYSPRRCEQQMRELLKLFDIQRTALLASSYSDLLLRRQTRKE